uniref:Uncharacterized protein n=1 Tax=Anopheles darlingi TaxID=43151 RepID=A0A2M4DBK3_ANODA
MVGWWPPSSFVSCWSLLLVVLVLFFWGQLAGPLLPLLLLLVLLTLEDVEYSSESLMLRAVDWPMLFWMRFDVVRRLLPDCWLLLPVPVVLPRTGATAPP